MKALTTASGPASSLFALAGTASAERSYTGQGLLPDCLGLAGLLVTFTAYQVLSRPVRVQQSRRAYHARALSSVNPRVTLSH